MTVPSFTINTSNFTNYLPNCIIQSAKHSIMASAVVTGLDVASGRRFTPKLLGVNYLFAATFYSLHCPLEAIAGRRSCVHSFVVAGTMGYVGVMKRWVGIPLHAHIPINVLYRVPAPILGGAVYGTMAFLLRGMMGIPI
jgi:hypothetical protein